MLRLVLTRSGSSPPRRECLIVGARTPEAFASSPLRSSDFSVRAATTPPPGRENQADWGMQGGRRGERTPVRDPRSPTEDPEMRRFAASWRSCSEGCGGAGTGAGRGSRLLHRGDLLGRVAGL